MILLLTTLASAVVPTIGEPLPAFDATSFTDGSAVEVPDPTGRYLIVELIRSVDW